MVVVKVGDTVFVSVPYAFAISDQAACKVCAFCLKTSKSPRRCSGCQFLHFCSRDCQVADWPDHKAECSNLKRCAPRRPREPARLMARIIVKWKREREDPSSEILLGTRRRLQDCMDHMDALKRDRERAQGFVEMLALLKKFLSPFQLEAVTDLHILEIFGKMCVNSIHVTTDEGPMGTALYLGASLIDHSCLPNLNGVFQGRNIALRAIRPINAESIADLSLSYIPLNTTKERRRDELRKGYYFTCECDLCTDKVEEMMTESDKILTEKVLELEKLNLNLSSTDNSAKALKEIEKLLANELKDLPDNDVAKVTAINVAADACVVIENYPRAMFYYEQAMPMIKQIYTGHSVMYAYKLLRVARLSTVATKVNPDDERVKRLQDLLLEAVQVSRVALGDDHFDTKDVALLYEELQASLRQKEQSLREQKEENEVE